MLLRMVTSNLVLGEIPLNKIHLSHPGLFVCNLPQNPPVLFWFTYCRADIYQNSIILYLDLALDCREKKVLASKHSSLALIS